MKNFREHHLLVLLDSYENTTFPLDYWVSLYFKGHPALGSKDRAYIAETIYALVRWKRLLDALSTQPSSWEKRLCVFKELDWNSLDDLKDLSNATRVSFPEFLYDELIRDYGEEKAKEICLISNTAAPTTVRANTMKITRDELLKKWQTEYEVTPTLISPYGIQFTKRIPLFSLPEFKAGLFEVQDEGSQLIADLVRSKPGDLILDFCAGAGGKTLAFAPKTLQKGQIYLHDIRLHALQEAKKRLKRAGIQNGQLLLPESPQKNKLKHKMDWVLVDSPCSGSGTLRRNGDMKWKIDEAMITRIKGELRMIFEQALSFLNPKGHIIYATCSILKQENEEQVSHFLKTYNLEVVGDPFQSFPMAGGMDGFFGVVLKRI